MTDAPLLSVRDLVVARTDRRRTLAVVDGASIDIAPGEVMGLAGERGSGKSALGAAIVNLLRPPRRIVAGTIAFRQARIDGAAGEHMRRLRGKEIGLVLKDPLSSLNPLQRVGDQLVQTILAHLRMSPKAARARAIALLDEVGVAAAARGLAAYPHAFSPAMRQRIAFALALSTEPDLIIADEPTGALDLSAQAEVLGLLKAMCADRGTAMLLMSRDIRLLAQTAHRIAIMYAGRIAEIGPVADIVKGGKHPYTRGLIGSVPSLRAGGERLSRMPGRMPPPGARPAGCGFHPRCPKAFGPCATTVPPMIEDSESRVSCWLYDEEIWS